MLLKLFTLILSNISYVMLIYCTYISITFNYLHLIRDGQTYPKRFLPELNKTQ